MVEGRQLGGYVLLEPQDVLVADDPHQLRDLLGREGDLDVRRIASLTPPVLLR